MRNFQEKTSWKNILESWPVLVILFTLVILFIFGLLEFEQKRQETAKKRILVEQKVNDLQDRKDKLVLDVSNLNTEQGKEKIFRENFGLAKEGEGLIVVIDDKKPPEEALVVEEKGFFDFLKNLFK